MKKICSVILFILIPVAFIIAQKQDNSGKHNRTSVLKRIESYKESGDHQMETWDFRIQNGTPNPPTKTDALVCDVWQRLTFELKILKPEPAEIDLASIEKAINVYMEKEWNHIAGYRPWTHWNFIRSLKAGELKKLAKEILLYIKKNGIKEPKE